MKEELKWIDTYLLNKTSEEQVFKDKSPLAHLQELEKASTMNGLYGIDTNGTLIPETVAVAKDRALESLTHTGDQFVLNILAEEKKNLQRHFIKTFTPGEDRFIGIQTKEANNGCPILEDALAYLECKVVKRMECGDHWLVYALVENGQLLNDGVTAVHFRKTGIHY